MFGIFKRYRRLLSRDAAESFNRMAAFLTNFCSNESIRFDRPDDPSADNPPCISLDPEWMAYNYVTLDTAQTITGTKTFENHIALSGDTGGHMTIDPNYGALEIYTYSGRGGGGYIDFHTNGNLTDYDSRIIDLSASFDIRTIDKNLILWANGTNAQILLQAAADNVRLSNQPTDTTSTSSLVVSTVGYGNSHYWRKDNADTGFLCNNSGTLSYIDFGTTSGTVAEGDHTHTTADISDWTTATADFLTSTDLSDYVTSTSLSTTLQGYAASDHSHDLRYARLGHSHGNISSDGKITNAGVGTSTTYYIAADSSGNLYRRSTSEITVDLSGYVTSSALSTTLANYASAQTVSDLADIVDGIVNAYQDASDVSSAIQTELANYVSTNDLSTTLANYVLSSDLGEYLEESDFPNGFLTAAASGASGTITVVTGVTWNGTSLAYTKQTVTVSNGLVTSLGSSSSTTINTPTVVTWS